MAHDIRNEQQARDAFWREMPFSIAKWRGKRREQNAYPTDVRVAWCDWVDSATRSGRMSEELASEVTL